VGPHFRHPSEILTTLCENGCTFVFMKLKEAGIVIKTVKHTDQTTVAHLFCKQLGYTSALVRTGTGTKKNIRPLLQPLYTLVFETEKQENKSLIKIQQPTLAVVYDSIPYNPAKSSVCFFIAEFLSKTLADHYINEELYGFIASAVELLDKEEAVANFHLWFLVELSHFYGFGPEEASVGGQFFSSGNGCFVNHPTEGIHCWDADASQAMAMLCERSYELSRTLKLSAPVRKKVLMGLVAYFRTHLGVAITLNTLDVLEEVFA
jgi:DNA repair protein RecO (recombination protein O)